jgi:carboxyl-terminal processing protease
MYKRVRHALRAAGFIVPLIGFVTSVQAQETAVTKSAPDCPVVQTLPLPPTDYGALFDRVVNRIYARYFDPEQMTRTQWIDRTNDARPAVVQSKSLGEAVALINALIGELKASYTPDDFTYYVLLDLAPNAPGARELITQRFYGNRPHFAGIGTFTTEVDGRHFIDGLLEGSPAARAGLKVGDEIVHVDGSHYHQIKAFCGKLGHTAKLGVRRVAGTAIETIDVPVIAMVPGLAFDAATYQSTRIIERDGKRFGYFRIWALMDREPILTAMARLSPSGMVAAPNGDPRSQSSRNGAIRQDALSPLPLDGLIIDLRGKVGGTDHSQVLFDLIDPRSTARFTYRGRPAANPRQGTQAPMNPSFRGSSVMLIDHHTRSAGEMVAHSFRQEKFGPLIGSTTAGNVLASQIEVVPGGLVLQIAVSRPEADGTILEGKGVTPDITVNRPIAFTNGADPVLDAAVARLSGKSN